MLTTGQMAALADGMVAAMGRRQTVTLEVQIDTSKISAEQLAAALRMVRGVADVRATAGAEVVEASVLRKRIGKLESQVERLKAEAPASNLVRLTDFAQAQGMSYATAWRAMRANRLKGVPCGGGAKKTQWMVDPTTYVPASGSARKGRVQ